MLVRLHDIAHARAGDKGDTSTLTVIPYDDRNYHRLVEVLTPERVREHLTGLVTGNVTRFELPNLSVLHFVCRESLGGGVTTSLAVDTHGKSLSSRLLAMQVLLPDTGPSTSR